MKKVGLITYYGENYGGMLQAYALQKYVKTLGYNCKLISNDFLYAPKKQSKKAKILGKIKRVLNNPFTVVKKSIAMRKSMADRELKKQRFFEFLNKYLEIDHTGYTSYGQYEENPPEYDVYLCGSDQIWNPNLYHENGFYLAGFAPEDAVRVSYASSVGVSSVTEDQGAFMKPFLEKFDLLSTRETEGSEIVKALTGKEVRTVIDPTLLLNETQWSEVASAPLVDGDYIFFYLFGDREYIADVKKEVRKLTGLKSVCIPYIAREVADPDDIKMFDVGPAEFISLIKNAKLVVTDSFHATAFSINLKVPFISLCRFDKSDGKSMNSRITTLLSAVDAEERMIDEKDVLIKEKLMSVDFEKIHDKLNELRRKDEAFLRNALKYEKENG